MTDIAGLVERLRLLATEPLDYKSHEALLMDEAADAIEKLNNLVGVQVAQSFYRDLCAAKVEIEQLSDMNDKLVDVGAEYEKELAAAKAENERLRAESDALVLAGSHWEDQSAEIARLRATLEWYADRAHYEPHKTGSPYGVTCDRGHRARAALTWGGE